MAYKPSRSSGILFNRYTTKANENRDIVVKMIRNQDYLSYSKLKEFSKRIYLYYLNDNKASQCFNHSRQFSGIRLYCFTDHIYKILTNNLDWIYKPLVTVLKENNKELN